MSSTSRRKQRRELGSDSEGSEDFEVEVEANPEVPVRRGRGRPPGSGKKKLNAAADPSRAIKQIPLDANGKPYEVANDELVLESDEKGEEKVNPDGELQGGRDYRVRTFTMNDRGSRLYMLSTEPARCMGFRDSYLLFQKHRNLWKVILSEEEKFQLIEREIIPHSYKGRAIAIITARSIFREFGARIVIGGHRVTDDYYEARAIEEGHTAEEVADPEDRLPASGQPYNKNQYVAWYGASSVYHQSTSSPMVGKDLLPHRREGMDPPDVKWLYDNALAVSRFNSSLRRRRQVLLNPHGYYEPHSGVPFYARTTQPARSRLSHIGKTHDEKVLFETVLRSRTHATYTGLKYVDSSVYENLSPELKQAIQQQVDLENYAER